MMTIRVRLFAACRERAKTDDFVVQLPDGATTESLWDAIVQAYPVLGPFQSISRLAVNTNYIRDKVMLQENDEVCIIPPVSGG